MDVLPPDASARERSYITPETFAAYVAQSDSYLADRIGDLERERNRAWRLAACSIAVGLIGVAIGALVVLKGHPQGWIMSYDSSTGRVGIIQRLDQVSLPPPVDNWLMLHYVEQREGYNDASADSAFAAVACMSDLDEQKRFAHWFNDSPQAPQQIFARARNHGYRTATAVSDPVAVGVGPNGAHRVQVRFKYADQASADVTPQEVNGTATFTVHKDRKAISPCDPAGIVISDYVRDIDKGEPGK